MSAEKQGKKTESNRIDITVEPDSNVALPLPATQSTYQRVEKGTRTALIYWDGWLDAKDAQLAEDDKDYFTKTKGTAAGTAAEKGILRRNTNLKKNWTYGSEGEVQYISTGFSGILDKDKGGDKTCYEIGGAGEVAGGEKQQNSVYGGNIQIGNLNKLDKPIGGPSVGTAFDLLGKAGNRSAYLDTNVKSGLKVTALGGDDAEIGYYGKFGAKSGSIGAGVGSAGGGNRSNYGKGGPGSTYMDLPAGASGVGGKSFGGAGSCNKFVYGNVPSKYGSTGGISKIGYGTRFDRVTGKYVFVSEDGYDGPYGANGSPYRQNWKYNANKEILYIPTGFVSLLDPGKVAPSGSGCGGGGNSVYKAPFMNDDDGGGGGHGRASSQYFLHGGSSSGKNNFVNGTSGIDRGYRKGNNNIVYGKTAENSNVHGGGGYGAHEKEAESEGNDGSNGTNQKERQSRRGGRVVGGPFGVNGSPYLLNWKYGPNREIIYFNTGFISVLDGGKVRKDFHGGVNCTYAYKPGIYSSGASSGHEEAYGGDHGGGGHKGHSGGAKNNSVYGIIGMDGYKRSANNSVYGNIPKDSGSNHSKGHGTGANAASLDFGVSGSVHKNQTNSAYLKLGEGGGYCTPRFGGNEHDLAGVETGKYQYKSYSGGAKAILGGNSAYLNAHSGGHRTNAKIHEGASVGDIHALGKEHDKSMYAKASGKKKEK